LEKAKRSGKAFLNVAGGKSLPSPFQLTGDQRWDKGVIFMPRMICNWVMKAVAIRH
jgi:hypothetical protein